MKSLAVVAPEKGRVELQEIEIGEPGLKQVQVRIHASLISPGTERAWILNLDNTPGRYPYEPGYCSAGIVEKVGPEVTKVSVGDRVACFIIPHRSVGIIGEEWVVKMPDEVAFEEAVFMPIAQIALSGVRKAMIELGEPTMVIGLGVIGQLALQLVRLSGALPAIGVDRVENRLETALKCGADIVVNSSDEKWMDAAGIRPKVVIDSTGFPAVIPMAFQVVQQFGRVVLTGSTRGDSTVNFYRDVHSKAISVIGAHAFSGIPQHESRPGYWTWNDDVKCIMQLLAKKKVTVDPLITEVVEWKNVEDAYKRMLEWNTDMIGTVIKWV